MRVMLVSSLYLGENKEILKTFAGAYPPLGILSIASVLRKEHDVAVLDCQFHILRSAVMEIHNFSPDVVGIATMTPNLQQAFRLARAAKSMGAVIVLGGAPLTVAPEKAFTEKAIDIVVVGEGEENMARLCRAIENGDPLSGVRGIVFRKGATLIRTGSQPLITNLNTLPMHAWDLVPIERYMGSSANRNRRESIVLVPSRGCPWHCTFCNQTVFGHQFRARSPRLVIEEIRLLRERYGKRDIAFRDDVTIFPRERIDELCRLLIEEKMDIEWNCSIRLDLVDKDLLELMKKAGCYRVYFGAESGSDRILKKVNKQQTVDTIRKKTRLIHKVGIEIEASFMIGLPGETEQDVLDTVRLATSIPATYSFIQFFHPHPGTDIYEEAIRDGRELEKDRSRMLGLLKGVEYVPNTLSAKFLVSTHKKAHQEICWSPKRVINYMRNIRSLDDIQKGLGATIEVLKLGKV